MYMNLKKMRLLPTLTLASIAVLSSTSWAGHFRSGWQPFDGSTPLAVGCWETKADYGCEPHGACVQAGGGICTQGCLTAFIQGQGWVITEVSCISHNEGGW